jgi:hypothetical protein
MRFAIKHPNLEIKEVLFGLVGGNIEYLHKRRSKKIVMAVCKNYLDVFNKFVIYVPSYASVVIVILEIDRQSKTVINTANP